MEKTYYTAFHSSPVLSASLPSCHLFPVWSVSEACGASIRRLQRAFLTSCNDPTYLPELLIISNSYLCMVTVIFA